MDVLSAEQEHWLCVPWRSTGGPVKMQCNATKDECPPVPEEPNCDPDFENDKKEFSLRIPKQAKD